MAYEGTLVLVLLYIYAFNSHPVIGRYVPKDESMKKNIEKSYSMEGSAASIDPNRINHWAIIKIIDAKLYGIRAKISVYSLLVGSNQESSSAIWLANGVSYPSSTVNTIRVGLQISPSLYGDSETRFFISWNTDEGQNTGCYNLGCRGFVFNNESGIYPGAKIKPLSQYDGEQHFLEVKILKDRPTGNWVLYADGDKLVGYWPKTLFTSLSESASQIQYGGFVSFIKGEAGPPMGSGHFSREGEGKAASIREVQLIDENGYLVNPLLDKQSLYHDNEKCYPINNGWVPQVGVVAYFGGPGGCKD